MEKESGNVIGIAFLFSIITVMFSFLDRVTVIFLAGNLLKGLSVFLARSALWVIIAAGIIIALYFLNKKQNQSLLEIFRDRTIRTTAGILVGISGLFSLSGFLPVVLSTISSLKLLRQTGIDSDKVLTGSILVNSINFVIVLCQIILGILLALKKEKMRYSEE